MAELEDKPPVRWTPARYNAWALDVLILAAGLLGLIALFYPESLFWNTENWRSLDISPLPMLGLGVALYLLLLVTVATQVKPPLGWRVLAAVTVLALMVGLAASPLVAVVLAVLFWPRYSLGVLGLEAAFRKPIPWMGGVALYPLFYIVPVVALQLPIPVTAYLLLLLVMVWLLPHLINRYDRDDKSQR